MKQGDLLEHTTLNWVKKELDAVLQQAKQALERYVERDRDKACLADVRDALHQVGGTLQMVELYGAAMLAQEMEDLAEALEGDSVRNSEDAVEVLLRAILQLPDYLEHVQAGNRDVPIVLLPLLNDLRTSRDASLLSERVLFFPEFENAPVPQKPIEPAVETENQQDMLRRLRHSFELGLLGWFRDADASVGLDRVFAVADRLYRLSGHEKARRLWWVSSALAEALSMDALESSVTVKSLMGKVDRQIKHYIDEGEQGFAERIPEELFKNLLYYAACAEDRGELIQTVKGTYSLNQLLPKESHLEEMRTHIAGPNLELLNAVSAAMREDLAEVKDGLEIYCSSNHKDPDNLRSIAEKLGPIADTLGMLGLGSQREEVLAQAQCLKEIVSGDMPATDATILDMAGTMLHVEAAIDSLVISRAAGPERETRDTEEDTPISEAAMREVLDSVTLECLRDIKFIKNTIDAFTADAEDSEAFSEIPLYLERMEGAMSVARVDSVLPLLQSLRRYISMRTLPEGEFPGGSEIEHLADAVASLEYFFESFNTQTVPHRAILDVGETSMARLGFPVPREGAEVIQLDARPEPPTVVEEITLEETPESTVSNVYPLYEALGAPVDNEAELTAPEPDRADPDVLEPQPPVAEPVELEASEPAAVVTDVLKPVELLPLAEGADEEILPIFLEEAQEETENITDQFPIWRDEGDRDALLSIRRAFHTLKGSGRLVGAQLMGEFSWSIENLLNRILDETIEVSDHVLELMEQAIAALPELIAQIRGKGSPATDPLILMAAAAALASRRGAAEAAEHDTAPAATGEPEAELGEDGPATAVNEMVTTEYARELARSLGFLDDESESAVEPQGIEASPAGGEVESSEQTLRQRLDAQLIDIFSSETSGHLDALRELLQRPASAKGSKKRVRISDELLRALHTLTGSASTAGIHAIAEVCGPIERAARNRRETNRMFTSGQVKVLVDTTTFVERVVAALRNAGLEMPDAGLLRAEIRREFGEVPDFAGPHIDVFPDMDQAAVDDEPEPAAKAEETPDEADEIPFEAADVEADETPTGIAEDESPAEAGETADEPEESLQESAKRTEEIEVSPVDNVREQERDLEEIFLEEASDILVAADNALQQWEIDRADETAISELQRQLHTLKGGARMAGFASIGDLSHALESLIIELLESGSEVGDDLFESLHKSCDRLNGMLEQAEQGQSVPPAPELIELLDTLRTRGVEGVADEQSARAPEPAEPDAPSAEEAVPPPDEGDSGSAPERPPTDQIFMPMLSAEIEADGAAAVKAAAQPKAPTHQELVRVRSELLDNLVNFAGEVNIYHARLEQQINAYGFNLTELEQTVFRLRDQLRNLELETEAQILFRYEQEKDFDEADFDPLELDRYSTIQQLSRSLAESVSDLVSIKDILYDLVRDSETLLLQQSRVSTDLQEGLMRTRMVQFSGLTPRLRRIARQTADELGRRVELEVAGQHSEMDRSVLDRMVAPLEHMLRNAISHGIEPPQERRTLGKPEQGQVKISVAREGTEIVIRVEDDGAGIDLERVRDKATELGLITDQGTRSDNDIMQFILESGFSTAQEVTQIAGRGVGMDVVNSEIKELGGVLRIDSSRGVGTAFTVRLPFTLAINQALLVQTGDDLYAVPLASIEGIVRLAVDELKAKYDQTNPLYEYAANEYELKYLGMLLGTARPLLRDPHAMFPVLLVKSGDRRVALQVDSLLGSREVVVKPVGPQISKVRGISGATILGDGRVVLILDVAGLVRMGAGVETTYRVKDPDAAQPDDEPRPLTIMVVDDSITIRKVTARMLERNHFSVVTAKDGIDAVNQLQDSMPDVMLLDIEMPRMDGYELATHVRKDSRLKSLPIIMITSRTGEKHRRRALDIGVDGYLGKPYQETDLLSNINDVLQARG